MKEEGYTQIPGYIIARAHGFMQKYKCKTLDTVVIIAKNILILQDLAGNKITEQPLIKPQHGGRPKGSGKYGGWKHEENPYDKD